MAVRLSKLKWSLQCPPGVKSCCHDLSPQVCFQRQHYITALVAVEVVDEGTFPETLSRWGGRTSWNRSTQSRELFGFTEYIISRSFGREKVWLLLHINQYFCIKCVSVCVWVVSWEAFKHATTLYLKSNGLNWGRQFFCQSSPLMPCLPMKIMACFFWLCSPHGPP